MRHDPSRGFLMDRVRQIRTARHSALKQHDEAVREALRESLGAVVRSPREVEDAGGVARALAFANEKMFCAMRFKVNARSTVGKFNHSVVRVHPSFSEGQFNRGA